MSRDRVSPREISQSSSESSPERNPDDDTDFFMEQANDSQSSIGIPTFRAIDLSEETERMFQQSPICRLPPEILITIFQKLSTPTELLNCMLVSKAWASNAVQTLWHRPMCNNWNNLTSVIAAISMRDTFFPYNEMVKRLNLSGLADKINDGTVMPFYACKRIERLTLTNCSKLTDQTVSKLVDGNHHLQALDVSELDSLTDHTLKTVGQNCERLQGLNITGCYHVTDESLCEVAAHCRQIKRVS